MLGAVASYVANYYTTSVGQCVANDLRIRTYHHLQQLSLAITTPTRPATLLSTITSDVQTIQGFASSDTLGIFVDLLTIIGMLFIMFWMNWDFTLIAVAVTPFMLLLVSRFKKAVKKATHEVRKEQSKIVSVVEQGLQSMRVVKAFGRQDLAEENLAEVSHATVEASLKARKVKALLVADRFDHGGLVHGRRLVARLCPDSCRGDDGRRPYRISVLPEQVLQAGTGSGKNDECHRAGGGRGGARQEHP